MKLLTEEQINEIIKGFDFEKVHDHMVLVGWKWHVPKIHTPSIGQMKRHVKQMLSDMEKNTLGSECGGFVVDRNSETRQEISLSFCIAKHTIQIC